MRAGGALRALRHDQSGREEGFVLVWVGLMMVVLVGMGALGIDVAHLYQVKGEAQKAADAAALAGAVYLPENASSGSTQAGVLANRNGFTDVTATQDSSRPSQMNVTVRKRVDNFLAGVLGIAQSDVSASASAEYLKPVAMGSPANQYGNDPESNASPGTNGYPNLWGNVASGGSVKGNGDAYQAGLQSGQCNADNCPGAVNKDYDPNGYYYQVHFNSSATVDLEIFDPGFVQVGDNCPANSNGSNLSGAAALTAAQVKGWPGVNPLPAQRYAPVASTLDPPDVAHPGTRYCNGDQYFGSTSNLPQTSWKALGPATIPGQPSTAPDACQQYTFPGVAGDLMAALQSNTKINVQPTNLFLGSYFRQWWKLCTISGSAGQDYFVQVKGNATGAGHNRFAIRARNAGTAVSISGNTKMGVYANAALGTNTEFYLARILPSAASHTLKLSLFDIGDGSGVTGTLTIKPPTDSNVGGSFSGCKYTPPPGNSTPPYGTLTPTSGNCAITGVTQSQYNGQWIEVDIPIPANYACTYTDPFGCWVKINYLFNGPSGYLNDTTSWSAVLDGDPVRLVK